MALRRPLRPRPAARTATGATSSTATGTGRSRRSSPTSTPAGTRSTWPSRTGRTTSTSARWSARRTRSWRPRCTSSATVAGTAAARWSPTATSTSATTRRRRPRSPGPRDQDLPVVGVDNVPGSVPLEGVPAPAGAACCCSGRSPRACPTPRRAAAVDVLHIAQYGSTRSINAGAAAAIAMHAWIAQHVHRLSRGEHVPDRRSVAGVTSELCPDTPLPPDTQEMLRWPSPPPRSTPR